VCVLEFAGEGLLLLQAMITRVIPTRTPYVFICIMEFFFDFNANQKKSKRRAHG